ncbi:hypothetical protein F5148DRAFT_184342 [Russula earlei]|uniref:Uncharacterized protein n=1 Tax=Russula earlei TaxID=71964 RepID=A0ACC0UJP8_9AGAM|nr:hypothetical protein F5148DRAFT_184342 [Russula earlei]
MCALRIAHSDSATGAFVGSTVLGVDVGSPRSVYVTDPSIIEEKVSQQGDVLGRALSPGFHQAMNHHRRDTGLTGQTMYSDPSAKIWGLYLSQAEKFDKDHSDSWTANLDGVLVFTGLLFATIAAFLVVSYPQLQPNPNDITNQLLIQISQQLSALPNGTSLSPPATLPSQSSFKPTAWVVRVNALWFTSLSTSTACALWATLMQQWTRRYVQVADRPYNPPKRARIRAFFADGVEKFALAAAVEVLPALLHASVLIFYIGLVDFLFHINHIIAYLMLALLTLGVLIYFLLTIMPLYFPSSPYQTPLSALVWFIIEASPLLKLWLRRRTDAVKKAIHDRRIKIGQGMRYTLEQAAANLTSQADARALKWTLLSLDDDNELEDFLDGLPGLFQGSTGHHSQGLKGQLERLVNPVAEKLLATCTTGLLPEGIRTQRLTACLGAIWCFSGTIDRHFRAIWDQWGKVTNDPWGLLTTETWAVAGNMTTDLDPLIAIRAHCIQALISVMRRDGRWLCPHSDASALLQRQLGATSADVERWYHRGGHLHLAVAANLLNHALPLLRQLETGPDMSVKVEVKAILNTICGHRELHTSDVPDDLRARFADGSEVMKVFDIQGVPRGSRQHAALDVNGPWTRIFTPVGLEIV